MVLKNGSTLKTDDYLTSNSAATSHQIPKVIYFLHLGPESMPDWAQENITAWREMNPDFQVVVLTDETRLPTEDEAFYKSLDNFGLRGDIDRVHTLIERGGLYLDWDMVPIRPLGTLLDGCRFCIGYSYSSSSPDCPLSVEPAFIASVAGYPILEFYEGLVRDRVNGLSGQGPWAQTGPGYWTDLMSVYLGDYPETQVAGFTQIIDILDMRLLPYTSFYLTAQGKTLREIQGLAKEWPNIWGAHLWAHSWCGKGSIKGTSE